MLYSYFIHNNSVCGEDVSREYLILKFDSILATCLQILFFSLANIITIGCLLRVRYLLSKDAFIGACQYSVNPLYLSWFSVVSTTMCLPLLLEIILYRFSWTSIFLTILTAAAIQLCPAMIAIIYYKMRKNIKETVKQQGSPSGPHSPETTRFGSRLEFCGTRSSHSRVQHDLSQSDMLKVQIRETIGLTM